MAKRTKKVGRPTRRAASKTALAGVDLSTVDPVSVLRSIAADESAPASAQVSTFDLSGTALDQSDSVLPGATVSLKNTKTGLVRTEVTDARGRYHFIALPVVGEYSVKVELTGFGGEERAGLVFQANTKPVIDFTLKVATLAEATTVVGAAPILETRKSELSLTVDQKKIETMPLNGRNYLDLATFANGVHGAATRGDLSVNGQLGRNIDYVVDGVSNKVIEWCDASKTGLSLDVVQEFQVITSQFSAEFGHSLGGIVSAVAVPARLLPVSVMKEPGRKFGVPSAEFTIPRAPVLIEGRVSVFAGASETTLRPESVIA